MGGRAWEGISTALWCFCVNECALRSRVPTRYTVVRPGLGFLRATHRRGFDPKVEYRRSDLCQTSVHTAPPHSYAVTSYHPATRDLCTHDRPATVLHTPAAPCAKERELRSASRHHHLWARTPPQDEHNKPCIDS